MLLLVGDLQRALEAVLAGRQGDGVAFLGIREDLVQVDVVHLRGRDDRALHNGGGGRDGRDGRVVTATASGQNQCSKQCRG
jgi:hypothetical protein